MKESDNDEIRTIFLKAILTSFNQFLLAIIHK